jgi:hypothetical protein
MKKYTLLVVLALFLPIPAMAYIDPGSGHLIWKGILGTFFSLTFLFKKWFSTNKKSDSESPSKP